MQLQLKPPPRPARARRRSRAPGRGVALIEVLVAILIFSFGVLGLIGLQAAMTRAQGTAKMRADAALVAQEIIGTIWTDRPNMVSYTSTGGGACASTTRCNDWLNKVSSTLPGGIGTVTTTSTGAVSVTVTWTTSAEGTHTYAISSRVIAQ